MAGTGKSTIALTIARELNENQRLGASFFFSRGEGYLSSTAKFVVKIAAQIAKLCPAINKFIEDSVSEHPRLKSLGLYDQWDKLVLQPLLRMPADAFPRTLIIVIDALDECDDADNISALIHCLGTLGSNGLIGVRIFVTSRPGKVLQDAFDDTFSGEISRGLITHDIDQSIINDDLTIFYRTKLPYVTKQHFQSDVNIRLFVEQSQGLFIHAATVCRFVEDGAGAPTQRIAMLLDQPVKPLKSDLQLDKMYATVLQHSFLNSDEVKEAAQIRELFKRIVGSIMVLFDSLSACDLSKLIDQPTGNILSLLGCLHSVVDVSSGEGNVIRLLHPSFRDFVLDPMRCLDSSFFVDASQAHGELLGSCLRVMSTHLHRNMGNLKSPGDRSYDVPESVINQRILNHVQYACRYWVHHLQRSSFNPRDFPGITEFFKSQFLFWLETLALLGQLSDGNSMIAVLQKLLDSQISPSLSQDA
ncbi:unnamed protein product [Penicillium olsonii]|nr:unnamed protein product [Penicillium olsonii]